MEELKLTDPSLVSMARNNGFRYNGKKIKFDQGYPIWYPRCNGGKYVMMLAGGQHYLDTDTPVYMEYKKQFSEFWKEQSQKAAAKRDAMLAEKKEKAKLSTMTSFEWRYRLAKEHGLYLKRRPYGMGAFLVYRLIVPVTDADVKNSKFIESNLKYDNNYVCGYSAYKVYTDETIQEVVAAVKRANEREMKRANKEIIDALKVL